MKDILFKSNADEWETPQDLYDQLNEEFSFNLDPCSTEENHKAVMYFTEKENGLKQSWGGAEYSAIRHTARLNSGCVKHIMSHTSLGRLL